jgi:hypothetical protein
MPTKTINVAPEAFLDHSGITVYHVYEQDNMDLGRLHEYFTTGADEEVGDYTFDIRTLSSMPSYATLQVLVTTQRRFMTPGKQKQWLQHLKRAYAAVIMEAIDRGLIEAPLKKGEPSVEIPPASTLCQKITALHEDDHSPLDESMVNELAELVAHLPMITALASAVRDLERLGILSMSSDATKEDRAKQAVRKAVADLKGIV